MITLTGIVNLLLIIASILFVGCYVSWAMNMVEHKNGHNGFWVFIICLVGGIFGLIACLMLPQDEPKTKHLND